MYCQNKSYWKGSVIKHQMTQCYQSPTSSIGLGYTKSFLGTTQQYQFG